MTITIRPIEFRWSDWVERHRRLVPTCSAAMKQAGDDDRAKARAAIDVATMWQGAAVDWFVALPENQKLDIRELAMAETEMLLEAIDPSDGRKPREEESTDFRNRYYILVALYRVIERASGPLRPWPLQDLEDRAYRINWLP